MFCNVLQSCCGADGAAAGHRGKRTNRERIPVRSPAWTDHTEYCCQTGEPVPEGETPNHPQKASHSLYTDNTFI